MIIFTPLQYCQFLELDAERDVLQCVTFAGRDVAGMVMCDRHGDLVMKAMDAQEVQLLRHAAAEVQDPKHPTAKEKKRLAGLDGS